MDPTGERQRRSGFMGHWFPRAGCRTLQRYGCNLCCQRGNPARVRAKLDIYMGHLSEEVEEAELRNRLGIFGRVRSTSIVRDRITNKPTGSGAVEMPEPDEAGKAIASRNGKMLKGQDVVGTKSHPHPQHH